jgi:hypothetical protein
VAGVYGRIEAGATLADCLWRYNVLGYAPVRANRSEIGSEVYVTEGRNCILILTLAVVAVLLLGCSGAETPTPDPTATVPLSTPTPTIGTAEPTVAPTVTPTPPAASRPAPTSEPPTSLCAGLSGEIEVQVLVGPAEAVGLEPTAVGTVPFAVTTDQAPFAVQGGGDISYADVLVERWGTYDVTLDLQTTLTGECVGEADAPALQLVLQMSGQQMVKVEAEGFQGEYPWSGETSLDLTFPLVEGATAQGEGWVLVLHLPGA